MTVSQSVVFQRVKKGVRRFYLLNVDCDCCGEESLIYYARTGIVKCRTCGNKYLSLDELQQMKTLIDEYGYDFDKIEKMRDQVRGQR